MKILAAIKREKRTLEKQLGRLERQLDGIRAAAEALGNSTSRQVNRELKRVKKRVMSAAGRAAIARGAKKRWAKIRAQAKKVAG